MKTVKIGQRRRREIKLEGPCHARTMKSAHEYFDIPEGQTVVLSEESEFKYAYPATQSGAGWFVVGYEEIPPDPGHTAGPYR